MGDALRNHDMFPPRLGNQYDWNISQALRAWDMKHDLFTRYETAAENALKAFPANNRGSTHALLLEDKDYGTYACIKRVAEMKLGINTAFVRLNVKRFDLQNASNIALKYNLRAGGLNHVLSDTSFAAIKAPAGRADTIVIGADVTHPGTNSSPRTPSIAAVVGNTDNEFMHFPGSMRLQRARKEFITELGDMLKERLID